MSSGIPVVLEDIGIPIGLFEAPAIDGLDPFIQAIDIDVIGPHTDNWAMFKVSIMNSPVLGAGIALPENPYWAEACGEVGVGDFCERGEEGRIDNVFVK